MIVLADFDLPTRSASGFLIRHILPRTLPPQLYGPLAQKALFSALSFGDMIVGAGHGDESVFSGQNEAVLLKIGEYDREHIRGKVIKLLSCDTGVALGPDLIRNGALSFQGYCLPGNTLITCNPIPKEISSMQVGDLVLGHDGNFHRVAQVFKRHYNGELIEITPYTMAIPIMLTPEHPVLARRKQTHWNENLRPYSTRHRHKTREMWDKQEAVWIQASNLSNGDFLILPIMQGSREAQQLLISETLHDIVVIDDIAYLSHRHWRNKRLIKSRCRGIKDKLPITPSLVRLIGYYSADGCLQKPSNKTAHIDFNQREEDYADDVVRIVEENFGFKPKVSQRGSVLRVSIHSRIIGSLFLTWCATGAENKRLPDWAMSLPEEYLHELLKGLWRGDGYFTKRDKWVTFGYNTISKILAIQISNILLKIGILPNLSEMKQHGKGRAKIYRIMVNGYGFKKMSEVLGFSFPARRKPRSQAFIYGTYTYLPIRKVKHVQFRGEVYNLEVERVNSYVCGVFSVHNCDEYVWVMDADYLLTPWADPVAALSLMPVVDCINALLDGKTAREAFDLELAGYTANVEIEEDEFITNCLEFNRENAVLLGDPNARIKRRPGIRFPIPPPPLLFPINRA